MDESHLNGILHLAQSKIGLPISDSEPFSLSLLVKLGSNQCTLTYDEIRSKLDVSNKAQDNVDCNPNQRDEVQPVNSENTDDQQEGPLDLSIKAQLLDDKNQNKYNGDNESSDSLSVGSEDAEDSTEDDQGSQNKLSDEIRASSPVNELVSALPDSLNDPSDEVEVKPDCSQTTSPVASIETVEDSSVDVEEEKAEDTSTWNSGNNQNHGLSHPMHSLYQPEKKICYWCQKLVYHRAWNCPERTNKTQKNLRPYANYYSKWRPRYNPYQRQYTDNWQRNSRFLNGPAKMNFFQRENSAPRRGTFRSGFRTSSNNSPFPRHYSTLANINAGSQENSSHHKVLFKGEWFTNKVAADAEKFLIKKEEVHRQIKRENRELDEGFEDIQLVVSEDECPNEDPTIVWSKVRQFKDEDQDPGGSDASFSAAA